MSARIAVLDIERTWGVAEGIWQLKQQGWLRPDQIIEAPRTICFAYKWLGEDEEFFHAEWDRGGHQKMIAKAHAVLDEATHVIGWNSINFDIKHLRTAFFQYDMTPPSPHADIDLMRVAKQNFAFLSNRMSYIAYCMDAGEKVQTGGQGLWSKLRTAKGDELREARQLMAEYNVGDIKLAEELFLLMRPWVKSLNLNTFRNPDEVGPFCANCNSDNIQYRGKARSKTRVYRRFQCKDCGTWGQENKSESGVTSRTA